MSKHHQQGCPALLAWDEPGACNCSGISTPSLEGSEGTVSAEMKGLIYDLKVAVQQVVDMTDIPSVGLRNEARRQFVTAERKLITAIASLEADKALLDGLAGLLCKDTPDEPVGQSIGDVTLAGHFGNVIQVYVGDKQMLGEGNNLRAALRSALEYPPSQRQGEPIAHELELGEPGEVEG